MPSQPGITARQLPHLRLAAFDVAADAPLGEVLAALEATAQAATGPQRTVALGLGPSLFDGRFGLCAARPTRLRPLPAFPRDALDPARSDGDVVAHAPAPTPAGAARAAGALAAAGAGALTPRWAQAGFLGPIEGATPRNLLGFKDGSMNLRLDRQLDRHVWIRD